MKLADIPDTAADPGGEYHIEQQKSDPLLMSSTFLLHRHDDTYCWHIVYDGQWVLEQQMVKIDRVRDVLLATGFDPDGDFRLYD